MNSVFQRIWTLLGALIPLAGTANADMTTTFRAVASVQLYLTIEIVPKKGYVDARLTEQGRDDGTIGEDTVAFRECESAADEIIWMSTAQLTEITGACDPVWAMWGGTVDSITASYAKVVTNFEEMIYLDSKVLTDAFGADPSKWPQVGQAIGGYNTSDPTDVFAIGTWERSQF